MAAKVSVLIPSFNHARFLRECIDSVIEQTYEDWEIVAIDDCSRDESVSILRSYTDPRIRVMQNEGNLGTYGTLARAAGEANGEFLAVLNSDDTWRPYKLKEQVPILEAHRELPLVYGRAMKIDEESRPLQAENGTAMFPDDWPDEVVQEILPRLLDGNEIYASSVVFRREAARFRTDLRYSGDWVALLDCSLRSRVGFCELPVSGWRIHGNNTYTRSAGQVQEEVRVRESVLSRPEVWQVARIPRREVNRGLGACARHLSALYLLQKRPRDARRAARLALRFDPSRASLRRLAAVSLPADKARRALWGAEPTVPPGPRAAPLRFG